MLTAIRPSPHVEKSPERGLACAVIQLALSDAVSGTCQERHGAIEFLAGDGLEVWGGIMLGLNVAAARQALAARGILSDGGLADRLRMRNPSLPSRASQGKSLRRRTVAASAAALEPVHHRETKIMDVTLETIRQQLERAVEVKPGESARLRREADAAGAQLAELEKGLRAIQSAMGGAAKTADKVRRGERQAQIVAALSDAGRQLSTSQLAAMFPPVTVGAIHQAMLKLERDGCVTRNAGAWSIVEKGHGTN